MKRILIKNLRISNHKRWYINYDPKKSDYNNIEYNITTGRIWDGKEEGWIEI